MSWQLEIPIIVRTLVNDLSETPIYSDDRILQCIVVGAKYVQFDVNLDYTYTIDVVNPDITPDPTEHNDSIFISLVSLKAACIIDQSTLRTKAALEGIRAALGPANLSVAGSLAGIKMILDTGPCATYDELTSHWDVKEATAIRAVLSPFVGNNFDPSYLRYPGDHARDLYS
ncbi:hypothetical protein EB118_25640 [bacterium]|nr:hypothetical protein [bacterium]